MSEDKGITHYVGDSCQGGHYQDSCIADLERQLAEALRLLNFTPDQLKLLVDPAKLAYVEWNLSSTYTLQLMCETYREGKMEVREAERQLAEAQGKLTRVETEMCTCNRGLVGMCIAHDKNSLLARILKEGNDGRATE